MLVRMTDWNREGMELGLTFFITGIICVIVIGGILLMVDVFTAIFFTVVIFLVPVTFAHLMIELYHKKWGLQKFTGVKGNQ